MSGFSPWLADHVHTWILWFAAICTLGLYSVLYKENKIYRLFEHLFLGLATGYIIATSWTDVLLPKWWEPMWDKGQWTWIFATVVGLMFYFIYHPKMNWLARLVIGFFLGVSSGQQFQAFTNDAWPQIAPSFKPLIAHGVVKDTAGKVIAAPITWPDAINNLLFVIILFCVMTYFFFSFEHKHGVIKGTALGGRWLLMFAFGAIFGSTIMGRLALLIDRMDFMLNEFGGQFGNYGPAIVFWVLMALVALVLFLVMRPGAREDESGEETPS